MVTEVREVVLPKLSIKAPLLTQCDNSSSFVSSLDIKLYNLALPFSPASCGSQHLLPLTVLVPGVPKPLPTHLTNLTFIAMQGIWQV
jgi:hypothetical protein